MKIRNLFKKPIDRSIQGVVTIGNESDLQKIQELEEYVVTNEITNSFRTFFKKYSESVKTPTDKMGVWITGFFGSGKSHFLKILGYLLENERVGNKNAIDYFDEKINDNFVLNYIKQSSQINNKVILFNIDATDLTWNDDYNFFTNNLGWESALFDGAGFQGTIDGRGYMLNGLFTSGQGFIARLGSNGVLKNIGFEGTFEGTWGGYISNHFAGTIENVYVKVSVNPVHGTLGFPSNILTGDFSSSGSVINNVIIVFDAPVHYGNVSSPLMGIYRPETHSDVYAVNTTGNVAGTLQEASDTVKTFADVEAFMTFIAGSDGFSEKWNQYWDTTGDYPLFINAQ